MQSIDNSRTMAAKTIQRFYHNYVKEQSYKGFASYHDYREYCNEIREYDETNDWYYGNDYDNDNDRDEGMFSLRNGDYTDDWETYIDDVYN